MTGTPIIKKVPGNTVKFNHEKDGYVSLIKLTKPELHDLLLREEKLANKKKFLDKLPDKGRKIQHFLEEIRSELKKRDEHENLCGLLSNLNVNDSKDALDSLEWTGKYQTKKEEIDGDDDVNPLRILATHSGTSISKVKQIKVQKSEELVKSSDLSEANDTNLNDIDVYARQLCHRFDSNKSEEKKTRFYTNKPLKSRSVTDVIKNEEPGIHSTTSANVSEVKMLSLEESIKIQQQQTKRLKEIEFLHAMEKLMNKTNINLGNPTSNIIDYREPSKDDSSDEYCSATEDEAEGAYDTDTAVFYNLVD